MLRVNQEAAFRVDFHSLMDSRLGENNEDRMGQACFHGGSGVSSRYRGELVRAVVILPRPSSCRTPSKKEPGIRFMYHWYEMSENRETSTLTTNVDDTTECGAQFCLGVVDLDHHQGFDFKLSGPSLVLGTALELTKNTHESGPTVLDETPPPPLGTTGETNARLGNQETKRQKICHQPTWPVGSDTR